MLRSWLFVVGLVACGGGAREAVKPERAEPPQLWVQVAGEGAPTVVFEAGGGEDSTAWAGIEPDARLRNGVRTIVYDRAGLGRSAPQPGPYKIDDEAAALRHALDRFSVQAPVVLVAHSYGGFIATLVAASDPRIAGVVLVDANLVGYFDDAVVARLLAKYQPQFAELERARPALARVMVPMMKAYPETVKRLRGVAFPPQLPVIDIVAEHSWGDTEADNEAMRKVHAAFVAASPARRAVLATGSGHDVMHDQPEVVLDAIARMVRTVRSR
jgi:pimeloyl-ACP methyl ester carboxylesterase